MTKYEIVKPFTLRDVISDKRVDMNQVKLIWNRSPISLDYVYTIGQVNNFKFDGCQSALDILIMLGFIKEVHDDIVSMCDMKDGQTGVIVSDCEFKNHYVRCVEREKHVVTDLTEGWTWSYRRFNLKVRLCEIETREVKYV